MAVTKLRMTVGVRVVPARFFCGLIGDISICNRAITSSTTQSHVHQGLAAGKEVMSMR